MVLNRDQKRRDLEQVMADMDRAYEQARNTGNEDTQPMDLKTQPMELRTDPAPLRPQK